MPRAIPPVTVYPRWNETRPSEALAAVTVDAALSDGIRARLAAAPTAEARGAALDLARSLSDDQVASLSNLARIEILERFLPQTRSSAEQAQTLRLLSAMELDPGFLAAETQVIDRLSGWLHRHYMDGYYPQNWRRFSDVGAMLCLKKIAAKHSELMGLPKAAMSVTEQAPRGRVVRNAWYDPATRAITLNGHHAACLYEIRKAMAMTGHINSLHHQSLLVDALGKGALPADSPAHTQARIFRLDQMASSLIGPYGDWTAYKRRPSERHANWLSGEIFVRLGAAPPLPMGAPFDLPKDLPRPVRP